MAPHILVIVSTTRKNRVGRQVADWYMQQVKDMSTNGNFELLDIADLALPLFNEPISPKTAHENNQYSALQISLAQRISKADGYVIVTAEYNGSVPGSLKNFIDYFAADPWENKPAAIVGYGVAGGHHATRHLRDIMRTLHATTINPTVHVDKIWAAFNDDGSIKNEHLHGSISAQVDELLFLADAYKTKRSKMAGL